MPVTASDLVLFAPVLILLGGAALTVTADLFLGSRERGVLPFISLGSLFTAGFVLMGFWGRNQEAFGGAVRIDDLSVIMGMVAIGATALSVLASASYVRHAKVDFGEYYGLMLTAAAGALLLAQANDLMSVFLGIEVLSISSYCLTAITRDREKSTEAAMKYFIMGAFATGFLLFGIALLYGAIASTTTGNPGFHHPGFVYSAENPAPQSAYLRLDAIALVPAGNPLLMAGLALFLIGTAFKVGAVPFHAWTPDAYEGAPAPVSGFMASVVKAGAFALFIRAGLVAFPHVAFEWSAVLGVIAAATMIVGNLYALAQTNLKRLLAYSSIGHTGYILVGVVVASNTREAASAVAFYVISYAAMTVGSFALISYLSRPEGELEDVSQLAGLASRRPGAAAAMTLFMAALAGIPPTAGFMGKFLVFREAVRTDRYLWLAGIGIATSMISAYYYLKIVVSMYMKEPEKGENFAVGEDAWGAGLALVLASAVTVILGVFPSSVIGWCVECLNSLV